MDTITLSPEMRECLQEIITTGSEIIKRRAYLILAYSGGMQTSQAALEIGMSRGRARYWKREFIQKGLAIFPNLHELKPKHITETGSLVAKQANEAESNQENVDPGLNPHHDKHNRIKRQKKNKIIEIPELPFPEPVTLPGILADDVLAEAGRKIFRSQLADMLSHEEGTRLGEDIEPLHDMRVASRRLRAAFDVFGNVYTKKLIKQNLDGLRQTGKLLGNVRDLDVFMENAEKYLYNASAETRQGLSPLLSAWQGQLGEARNRLLAHLDSISYREFIKEFNYFVQTPGYASKVINTVVPMPRNVSEITPCLIYDRLALVRAYSSRIDTASISELHMLRIEFKKLRYVLEFFVEVLGKEAKQVIETIKTLQDHLGELHDADVACQILTNFLEHWDGNQAGLQLTERQNPESIVNYLAFQHSQRYQLLVTFPQAWTDFANPDIMRMLALAVSVL